MGHDAEVRFAENKRSKTGTTEASIGQSNFPARGAERRLLDRGGHLQGQAFGRRLRQEHPAASAGLRRVASGKLGGRGLQTSAARLRRRETTRTIVRGAQCRLSVGWKRYNVINV